MNIKTSVFVESVGMRNFVQKQKKKCLLPVSIRQKKRLFVCLFVCFYFYYLIRCDFDMMHYSAKKQTNKAVGNENNLRTSRAGEQPNS